MGLIDVTEHHVIHRKETILDKEAMSTIYHKQRKAISCIIKGKTDTRN